MNHKEYYDNEYSDQKKKLKNEFHRIDSSHFLYIEYDTNNNMIAEGALQLNIKLHNNRIDTVEKTDLKGNVLGLEITKYNIKYLEKSKDWMEIADNHYQYNGKYIDGLKEGLWKEQKNYSKHKHSEEKNLYYKNGTVVKIDTVNQVLYNKPLTKKQVCKYWGEVRENTHEYDSSKVMVMEALSEKQYSNNTYRYFENNTVRISYFDSFVFSDDTCNWRLKDNKIILWKDKGKEGSRSILSYNGKYMVLGDK